MKKIPDILISTLGVLCAFTQVLNGQFDNAGTSAANFLKIGVGSRSEAMGGASVADFFDASALPANPASLARLAGTSVVASQTDWILDLTHHYFGLGIPVSPQFGVVGLSIISLSMEDLFETTESAPEGTGKEFSAGNFSLGLGYARALSDRFSVGVHVKYIRETISFSSASAVAFDIGTLYTTDFYGARIGMSISNFGTKMRMRGTEQLIDVDIAPDLGSNPSVNARLDTKDWALPLTFRFGVSIPDLIQLPMITTTVNMDYFDPRDFNPYLKMGGEAWVGKWIALRGGVNRQFQHFDNEGKSHKHHDLFYSAGLGLRVPLPTGYSLFVNLSSSSMAYFDNLKRVEFALEL